MLSLKKHPLFFIMFAALFLAFFSNIYLARQLQASLDGVVIAKVSVNPLTVAVSAQPEAEIGKAFKVKARIGNKGEEVIKNTSAEINLPAGLALIGKDAVKTIGSVRSFGVRSILWTLKGIEPGNYIIIVSANGEVAGYPVAAQGNTSVSIVSSATYKSFLFPRWFWTLFGL